MLDVHSDLQDRLERLRAQPRRLLAVFPHPDDEAYGCAGLLHRCGQRDDTASALITLTRGEASTVYAARGLTREQVGDLRAERLEQVQRLTGLDELIVGSFPDGRLARLPVAHVAEQIGRVIDALRPQVVVGHCPRGVNGHADHIATHWILRHALSTRPGVRFAMITYPQDVAEAAKPRLLFPTRDNEMDAALDLTPDEVDAKEACLQVHEGIVTLKAEGDGLKLPRPTTEFFDLLGEDHAPWLDDVFDGLTLVPHT